MCSSDLAISFIGTFAVLWYVDVSINMISMAGFVVVLGMLVDDAVVVAERIELRQDGRVVGEHSRAFGRGAAVYNAWHYVPVLARKPGALRNGAPFREWELPVAIRRVQRKLERQPGGDRQMVDILSAVLTDGIDAVEAACAEALSHNVHSSGVVLNILARRREPPRNVIATSRRRATPPPGWNAYSDSNARACRKPPASSANAWPKRSRRPSCPDFGCSRCPRRRTRC